jgi:hypothetical protein
LSEGIGVRLTFDRVDIDAEGVVVLEVELHNIRGLVIVVEMIELYTMLAWS